MSPFTTFVGALVLGLVIAAALLFGGAPLLVLPIIVVPVFVLWLSGALRRARRDRSLAEHREQAKAEKVEFTDRDKQTLTR
jgi:UDP-N-acetylmuramyl pentapeptide phosphotransferase/UDP-N-acetylglucosamine-1-phosphate transferase